MLVNVSFSIFILMLGILTSTKSLKYGLEWAFLFIIAFTSLRYDYGNDYMTYYHRFYYINNSSNTFAYIFKQYSDISDRVIEGSELGWVLINRLCKPIGFYGMVAIISTLTNLLYYSLIKKYIPREWQWFALFTYIFSIALFHIPLSMMRESLAVTVFLFTFRFIEKKKLILSLLFVVLAALIHKSAAILFPFIFLGFAKQMNGKMLAIAFMVLFVTLFMSVSLVSSLMQSAFEFSAFESYQSYEGYGETGNLGFGFFIRVLVVLVPFILFIVDDKMLPEKKLLVFLACIPFIIDTFTRIIGIAGRMDYYFSIFYIFAMPLAYGRIKQRIVQIPLILIFGTYTLYTYYLFFTQPGWASTFLDYQTIIGH